MIMSDYVIWLILCLISGLFYHLGGLGADGVKKHPKMPKWMFSRYMRRWGCAIVFLIALGLPMSKHPWIYLITYLAMWFSLTAYWKKGVDMKAKHWFFHGLGIGLAAIPLAWIGIAWWLILARAIVLAVLMMWISERTGKAWLEESVRGFLIPATIILLRF